MKLAVAKATGAEQQAEPGEGLKVSSRVGFVPESGYRATAGEGMGLRRMAAAPIDIVVMMLRSLNRLSKIRDLLVRTRWLYLTRIWGMDIHPTATFSLSARFDKTHPRGVHIGAETYIAFDAAILSHDTTRRMYRDTVIGRRCFIGARSLVLPGVTIGDECVVGSGSIVTKDVPPRSVVAGNPARVLRSDIRVGPYGRFEPEEPLVTAQIV